MAEDSAAVRSVSPFNRRNQRLFALLALLLFVGAIKLGQQLYGWVAFEEERERIAVLDGSLEVAGLGVIATQVRSDSIRGAIASIDEELFATRDKLETLEEQASTRAISTAVERTYRRELTAYNANIERRNELFRAWSEVVEVNHGYVARYNALVDSIRGLAAEMGEPYYPILSPAEIANRNGIPAPVAARE